MKIFVTLSFITIYITISSCRPQSVQVERQNLYHVQNRALPSEPQEKRGSVEETKRILQEIDRINNALGYTRRYEYAYPRVVNGEGYFYPRQQFRPEFLTKPKKNPQNYKSQRAINPFNAQNYFYPAPYLNVPMNGKPLKFKTIKNSKYSYYPLVYSPLNVVPLNNYNQDSRDSNDDNSVRLGTIVVMQDSERMPKAVEHVKSNNTSTVNKKPSYEVTESSLIEDLVNFVPEALGLADEDDDDDDDDDDDESIKTQEVVTQKVVLPAIKNDKYLNLAIKKHPQEIDEEEEENRRKLPTTVVNRAFNFSNSIEKIQNITKQFTFKRDEGQKKSDDETTTSTLSPEDVEDEKEEKIEDKEDEKSPFGFVFGPKQQLSTFKEGGLIIQRLRVRHGGIAIAGPGGVATAGSGGTAIVGPNGIALTHPRPNFRFEQVDDSVRLPYIGGAKGQVLEIRQRPDGSIFSRILMDDVKKEESKDHIDLATVQRMEENSFEANLMSIQQAAADLVAIQESYKESGKLTNEQRRKYSQSLAKLGVSAQKLANIQGEEDNLRLLLEEPQGDKVKGGNKKKVSVGFPPFTGTTKKEEECEEGEVGEESGDTTTSSSVAPTTTKKVTTTSTKVTTTKKPIIVVSNSVSANSGSNDEVDEESSVAEAKPVGLAIAGVGGVASSKPHATAIVGPNGLAVASPKATAISGLKPSDISGLGLPLGTKLKNLSARGNTVLPPKGKYGLVSLTGIEDDEGQVLVGPEFLSESRLSDKGIDSNDNDDDVESDDKVENEDINAQESDNSKRPNVSGEIDNNNHKQIESVESPQFPYTIDLNKYQLFPPSYENVLNYPFQNPYFLPPNSYNPIPIINQYLQRRAALRIPSIYSQYPSFYGQNVAAAPSPQYAPIRFFYAPQ